MTQFELRTLLDPPEFRSSTGGALVATGVAVRYGARSKMIGGRFTEEFRSGAFAKTLAERDVTANHEHDRRLYLGRTSAGTLRFEDTADELRYELSLPDTAAGRDVAHLAERGDLRGSSVGFRAIPASVRWTRDPESGVAHRSVGEATLDHVATTCYPAYDDSTVELALRSLAAELDRDPAEVMAAKSGADLGLLIAPDPGDESSDHRSVDGRLDSTVHRARMAGLMY